MTLFAKLTIITVMLTTSFMSLAGALQRDPFQRPDLNKLAIQTPIINESAYLDTPPVSWHPRLRGTLRSASGYFANVDGQVIKLWDTIEGFLLIAVSDRTATFTKQAETVVLSLDDDFENGIYKSENDAL
ncbi:MAG: hypothetical protein MUQ51_02095 [Pseudomonadota bacterium]|nr:hypothetical protein [Pseudomonadota bacterium]MDO7710402.1 hypothetical protein [Pseudomonadota bacterium]